MAILRIPALIDPHIHLIESDQEAFQSVAAVARKAGYGAIQIMPDLDPPITDKITAAHYSNQTHTASLPIHLVAAGTSNNHEEIKQLRTVNAIKVWLGTGPEDLVVTKEEDLRQLLLSTDKIVMIHCEDETTLLHNFDYGDQELTLDNHDSIFDKTAALRATVKAITAAKETGRRVYLCHISTGEEVELVRQAKAKGIRVMAEVAPHHLFLDDTDLERLDILGKVNPPLRSAEDRAELWRGINDGTIDVVSSDSHAWLRKEKEQPYDQAPSGLPNLEYTLPLLITAVHEKRLTFQRAIDLLSTNPGKIFSIPKSSRSIYIDLDTPRRYQPKLTDWQPYGDKPLVGWPVWQRESRYVSC
jgi:dihydroorotase